MVAESTQPQGAALQVAIRVARGFTVDVEFIVPPGVTALFGPSGAGKSTTLAAIAGLVKPERGRIALGTEIWFDDDGPFLPVHRRKVAYVFQSLALFPHMTARQNVEYGIDRRIAKSERDDRALAMLERMRVKHLADRKPSTFSGGEAQRVALARAFAMEPKIVLLDEAFSAMDRDLRRELSQDVRKYIEDVQIPAILVTHQRNEARALADRVILIDGGSIKAVGTVDDLLPKLAEDV